MTHAYDCLLYTSSFALSLMLIIFVMTIYVPAGIILLIADLLLIQMCIRDR